VKAYKLAEAMRWSSSRFVTLVGVVLIGLVSVAVAHGEDEDMSMDMGMGRPEITKPMDATVTAVPNTYFNYGEHTGLLLAHVLLMTIGWVFVLPIGKKCLNF
jgi:hypothetical protein